MTIGYQEVQRKSAYRQERVRGFTLIELMVTISIAAILTALAAPSFQEMMLSSRLTSAANSFIAHAQLARSEAIKRNAAVGLCRSANGTSCAASGGWEQGWIVFQDSTDSDGVVTKTVIQNEKALAAGYQLTGDAYNLTFAATGFGSTQATLTLCRKTPSAGSQERDIRVSPTGRILAKRTRTGVCT